MNRSLLYFLLMLPYCACVAAGEPVEQPVALTTRAGSRLYGLLSAPQALTLRTPRGAAPIDWNTVVRIHIGERVDPNRENEARNALGDLLSDNYETRQKALRQLRELGRAALRPLREMLAAPDPELGRQARALLAELGELGASSAAGDLLQMKDGTRKRGDVTPSSVRFRTRWGCWSVPLDAVDEIEPVGIEHVPIADLAAMSATPATLPTGKNSDTSPIQPWSPPDMNGPMGNVAREWNHSMTMLDFDTVLGADEEGKPKLEPLKAGTDVSNIYANRGLLLRLSSADKKPIADPTNLNCFSGAQGVSLDGNDALWVHIIQPGSFNAQSGEGEAAGTHTAGAFISGSGAHTVGLAAYDKAGRILGVVYNEGALAQAGNPAAEGASELLAIRAAVPVSRLRIFRVGEGHAGDAGAGAKEKPPLRIDDLFVDWIVSADRSPDLFSLTLRSGERLCGMLKDADWQKGLKIQAEFLPPDAAPLPVSSEDITVFDTPSRRTEPAADKKRQRLVIGNQHAVLLQNGEKFHACFVKLDDKEALFLMSGQVELHLPRTLLRKIDLQPSFDPQTGRATVSLVGDEKAGVEFRKRERKQEPGEKGKEEPEKADDGKKKDVLQQQQELKRMENTKIVEADLLSGDLTVDDGGGDWTIGLAPVKALIFAPDAEAAAQKPGFHEWQLILRDHSRFDVIPLAMNNESLTVQIANGVVQMPFAVFESLQRKK